MKALEVSRRLVANTNISETLQQLSTFSKKTISKQVEDAGQVLENCKNFCSKAAGAQRFGEVVVVLRFIRKANQDDEWLRMAAEIIFPSLPSLYSLVLRLSDPEKRTSPKPGLMNMAITPAVQKSAKALLVLCRIYDLCIDFCEVDWDESKKHLRVLAGAAAATLFGSNFQRERATSNDTEYARDEMARLSSYALSNILFSRPSIIPDASKILGKRIPTLMNVLFAAPELSIQRSIILVLRLLYDNAKDLNNLHADMQRKIENGLSATRFGNGAGLHLFKDFDVNSDDADTQAEVIISKMLDNIDIVLKCFTCNCTVQMRGKVNGRMKKGGSVRAPVDWNKNSIVVHAKNQPPAYFPLHNISTMKWLAGHKEIRLTFRSDSELKDTQLTVRFGPGNRAYLGQAIENRIKRVLSLVSEVEPSLEDPDARRPCRKTSVAYDMANALGMTSSHGDDDQGSAEEENDDYSPSDNQCDSDERVCDAQTNSEQSSPRKNQKETSSAEVVPRSQGSAPEGPALVSGTAAKNVSAQKYPNLPQETEKGTEEYEVQQRSLTPSLRHSENDMDAPDIFSGKGELRMVTKVPDGHASSIESSLDRGAVMKGDGGKSWEQVCAQSGYEGIAKEENQVLPSREGLESSDLSEKKHSKAVIRSQGVDTIAQPNGDTMMSLLDKPKPGNSMQKNVKPSSIAFKQHTGFRKRIVASSNDGDGESTIVSIQSSGSNPTESRLSSRDERIRVKLLHAVREVVEARQKKSSQISRDNKSELQRIRATQAKKDRELVVKFVTALKKHATIQRRKIDEYKAQKTKLISAAKGRIVKLRRLVSEVVKRMKSTNAANKGEIGNARKKMNRVRDRLIEDLQRCIVESVSHKNSRSKTDSLFQGIAKLLQTN